MTAPQDLTEERAVPNLWPVIQWLEGGCDPKQAAKELRIYAERIESARAAIAGAAAPLATTPAQAVEELTNSFHQIAPSGEESAPPVAGVAPMGLDALSEQDEDIAHLIERLAAVPKVRWSSRKHHVEVPETEDLAAVYVECRANKLIAPKVARYIAACNPVVIAKLLAAAALPRHGRDGVTDDGDGCEAAKPEASNGSNPPVPVGEAAATNLKTVKALARRLLWIAYCWNDHNFDKSPLDYALEEAEQHGINSFEEANALIEQMKLEQEAQPTSEAPAAKARAVLTEEEWQAFEQSDNPHLRCGCGASMPCAKHYTTGEAPAAKAVRTLIAPHAVWLIFFDDYDRRPEIIIGEAAARHRFARISDNWNAHLFVKVESNTRDDPYAKANAALSGAAGVPHIRALLGEVSPEANLASTLIRPATVDDFMRLADVMAQRLAEYLYDHEDGKSKEAADDYTAARDALKAALVSGVVEVTDGMPPGVPQEPSADGVQPTSPAADPQRNEGGSDAAR